MNFSVIGKFFKHPSVNTTNAENKHNLHRSNANLSCFQKSTFYAGIKVFNSLSPSVTILKNEKAKFKATLRNYLHTHFLYSAD